MKARHVSMLFALATAGGAVTKYALALWIALVINVLMFIFGFGVIVATAPANSVAAPILLVLWFLIGIPVGTFSMANHAMKP